MIKIISVCVIAVFLLRCAVDPLDDRNPAANDITYGNPESIRAWLWAFDSLSDSIVVYHTIDKRAWKSFHPAPLSQNGFLVAGLIGGGIYPTLWTWKGSTIYSITSGILDHSDHGHIVHPYLHKKISLGPSWRITGMSVSLDGTRIIASALDSVFQAVSGYVLTINYLTGDTSFFHENTPVTLSLSIGSSILSAWEHSIEANILGVSNGNVLKTITIDTLVSCGVFHAGTETAFLACQNGVQVIDMASSLAIGLLEYASNGRVTYLFNRKSSNQALGLFKTEAVASDRVIVLDMIDRSIIELVIPGASLAANSYGGTCIVSEDGSNAILADLVQPILYRISLGTGGVEKAVAPDRACQVACNWDGSIVWALARAKAYQVSFKNDAIVDSIAVANSTSWIMVTSFRDNGALFDSYDHTF